MSSAAASLSLATVLLFAAACGDARSDAAGSPDMSMSGTTCTAAQYEAQIGLFCRAQFPVPAQGATGASCTGDSQCTSQLCLMPFGSGEEYCSLSCPQGNECPAGYACQDSGSRGPVCYRQICAYAGSDQAGCVTVLKQEATMACLSGCAMELKSWMDCLSQAGLVCGLADADQKCGIERGFLESCCPGCDSQDL